MLQYLQNKLRWYSSPPDSMKKEEIVKRDKREKHHEKNLPDVNTNCHVKEHKYNVKAACA